MEVRRCKPVGKLPLAKIERKPSCIQLFAFFRRGVLRPAAWRQRDKQKAGHKALLFTFSFP